MTTSLDAYKNLLKELDKWESPTFSVGDFNYFFNSTIDQYVALMHAKFDVDQKSLDNLRAIVVYDQSITLTNGSGALPDEYRHMLGMEAVLKFTEELDGNVVDSEITVYPKRLRSNRVGFAKPNAYHKPSYKRPYYQISKGNIQVLNGAGTSVVSGKISYIEKPDVMYLNPDTTVDYNDPANNSLLQFPDHVNYELIKHCRRIFLENIESQRYQSSLNEQALRAD